MPVSRRKPSRTVPRESPVSAAASKSRKSRKVKLPVMNAPNRKPPENPEGGERQRPYTAGPSNIPGAVFLPDHQQLVRLIAAKGMTDADFELVYGLEPGTLKLWRKHYPSLDKAISEGRTSADADVLFALYNNAVGFTYQEEQAVGGREPTVLSVKRFKPGETTAQKHWLGNRLRNDWPQVDRHEHSGPNGGPIGVKSESRNDLIDAILTLVTSKPDPEKAAPQRENKR